MLFEEGYSSACFKQNPKKEGRYNLLSNGKEFSSGFLKFDDEEKEECLDTTNAKSDAFSSPFFGAFSKGDEEKWKDVQPWNIPFPSLTELSLEDLASTHLQNHKLSTRDSTSVHPQFASQGEIPAIEAEDNLEKMDDLDVEAKKACLDTVVIGVKELSLQERCPSSFGRVLCRKVGPSRKNHVFCDVQRIRCPPQIKPFNFTTPSPDDIVRNSQKLRK